VAFADEPADALVRFAEGGTAHPDAPTIAPHGDGLWRRAPWPAGDALFELTAPADGAVALVVGPDAARRAQLREQLAAHGVSAADAQRLRMGDLTAAAIVVFLDDGGFPSLAPAACAAGRLVIVQHPAPLFGWQDGVDCFVAEDDRAVVLAQTVARTPRAYDSMRAMGRLTARAHRASDVYARLALDLEAQRRTRA
jgi:hypothetical protein